MQLFICFYWCGPNFIESIVLIFYFHTHITPELDNRNCFKLIPDTLLCPLNMAQSFFEYILTFGHKFFRPIVYSQPQTSLNQPILQGTVIPFHEVLYLEINVGSICSHCYWSIIASSLSKWKDLAVIFNYVYVYKISINIYLSIYLHPSIRNHEFILIHPFQSNNTGMVIVYCLSRFVTPFSTYQT